MVGRWSAMESVTYLISRWFKFKFLPQPLKCVHYVGKFVGFFITNYLIDGVYVDLTHFRSHSIFAYVLTLEYRRNFFNYFFSILNLQYWNSKKK